MQSFIQNILNNGRCPVLVAVDGNTLEIGSVNAETAGVTFANGCQVRFPLTEIDARLCDGRLAFAE